MKRCFRCGELKSLVEFYRHPNMADGHLGKCKDCARADVRANRKTRLSHYREYDVRRYREDDERRARSNEQSRIWGATNPEKRSAHNAVSNAVRDGRLKKEPCRVCSRTDVHGHHPDYSKPLDVVWLCPVHHAAVHQEGLSHG